MERNPSQIVRSPIRRADLRAVAALQFGDLVKAVVDVERGIVALGAELHSDEEAALIDDGSKQSDIWGVNLYPDATDAAFVEFDSMINIRPADGNRSRGVEDAALRERLRTIVLRLVLPE
jgi:hypothetical protein